MVASWIALRYLVSKKSHAAVNIISRVSLAGIAVASAAIVVVLSVFNGFTDLAMSRLGLLDPDVKVVAEEGKVIADGDSLARALSGLGFVVAATPTVEEQALAVVGDRQMPVRLKGVVREAYDSVSRFSTTLIAGTPWLVADAGRSASLSVGAANSLRALVGEDGAGVGLYVPRRLGRFNPANPAASFRRDSVAAASVFRTDQAEFDTDMVITDLATVRGLLDYTTEATSVEVRVAPGASVADVGRMLGPGLKALDRVEQEAESFRMISVEKWIAFMLLGFILVIASFNIISSLSMLILEKESGSATLRALGASPAMIKRIFVIQGWMITVAGGAVGAIAGVVLCLLQQHFEFIKLSGDAAVMSVTAYPVRVDAADLAAVAALIILTGLLTSAVATSGRIPGASSGTTNK